jgi:glycosyltransferase involved in cell wall biosynthesis
VSPFLPVPSDAGQRKRVRQFCEFLRSEGCRITFLHYAVENPFYWSHHDGIHAQAAEMFDEIITVNAGPAYGQAPKADGMHKLDEWWDAGLEVIIGRIFGRRWFDLVVVNNVWLTKVFDYVPTGACRILDTHDVFWERKLAFDRINQPPDFFVCSRDDEAFGWNRAHVVVAIADTERDLIAPSLGDHSTAINLPYTEPTVPARRRGYLHPEKVVFGFFGSGHPFNVHGLKALLGRMKTAARWAPIELVVAGQVGKALTADEAAMVRDLGYVDEVQEFYDQVDIVVSPLDYGSGLKIKVVEAVALGVPLLVTRHSAIGTGMARELVVSDVDALADAMAAIATRRPSLESFADAVERSQETLAETIEAGQRGVLDATLARQEVTVFRYPELELPESDPRLWALIGMIREFSSHGPVALDLGEDAMEPAWLSKLPPRVRLLDKQSPAPADAHRDSRARFARHRLKDPLTRITLISNLAAEPGFAASVSIFDGRWEPESKTPDWATHHIDGPGRCIELANRAADAVPVPWWSDSMSWDPVLPKRKRPTGAHRVALLMPSEAGTPGETLATLVKHVCQHRVDVLHLDSLQDAFVALEAMHRDPPAFVLELSNRESESLCEEWCKRNAIPFAKAVDGRSLLGLARGSAPARTRSNQNWTRITKLARL